MTITKNTKSIIKLYIHRWFNDDYFHEFFSICGPVQYLLFRAILMTHNIAENTKNMIEIID